MDSSRRAVEAYWRSRMIDGVTSDEDKVAPVYKLEEICELLRTSHVSIVKEVSEYILKRLDHKSPIVKQKALRLIKYAVGKSGAEFRREMQRHSAAMRQLFHYKGYPDPLKGDSLNKAVRDTAHEAISSIFASDDNKAASTEGISKRIQGFGNTNFEMPMEDKKSFLSEVVGLGSASIKQGLSTIAAAHSMRKSDSGNYKSPNLRRSLTTEIDNRDRYEGDDHRESWASSAASKNVASASWSQDSRPSMDTASINGDTSLSHAGDKSREERLLESIVASGGVRLQPTRDTIQSFLVEASKMNAMTMSHALESKLQSHLWQVRMKALCVLESILRRKDDAHFSTIVSYFSENRDCVVKCSESPQASLREKANKVLSLLDGEDTFGAKRQVGVPSSTNAMQAPVVPLPDLIDTGETDDYGSEDTSHSQIHQSNANLTSTVSLVDDLFGSEPVTGVITGEDKKEDDPFADVSFHMTGDREQANDIFSGLTVDEKRSSEELNKFASNQKSDLLDVFGPNSDQLLQETANKNGVHDIMASLSINEIGQEMKQSGGTFGGPFSGTTILDASNQPSLPPTNAALNGIFGPQMVGMSQNAFFPASSMQYNGPKNVMFNQAFASQPMNHSATGNFITQQQLLFQNFGHHASGSATEGSQPSPLPDIFQFSNSPLPSHSTMMMSSSKKEETKAFDFISDHLSAARDPKRVV